MANVLLVHGNSVHLPLQDASVQCCITSPPYFGLRSYLDDASPLKASELGSERLHDCNGAFTGQACGACWICHMRQVFREVWRVLRNDGTLWVNIGDSYNAAGRLGHGTRIGAMQGTNRASAEGADAWRPTAPHLKDKNLCGMPWRLALALQADGWYLRSEIIWHKLNPMPESVEDRCTRAHEQVFLLTKQARYFMDMDAIREPQEGDGRKNGHSVKNSATPAEIAWRAADHYIAPSDGYRNARSVWAFPSEGFSLTSETSRRVPVARDAVSGDTMCKVLPSCPVHGGLFAQASNESCDVRVSELLRRTIDIEIDPAQVPIVDSVPIDQQRGGVTVGGSRGCSRQAGVLSATAHNSQSRKMAPVPLTTAPYTVSAQTSESTADTSRSLGWIVPSENSDESNTPPEPPSSQTAADNTDTHSAQVSFLASLPPECMCIFYNIITEKSSHFATFPTALVSRCIRAGSSISCCPQCITPYRRATERTTIPDPSHKGSRFDTGKTAVNGNGRVQPGERYRTQTLGFSPACSCIPQALADGCRDAGHMDWLTTPVPSVVCDPFSGAGTTVLTARQLGRHGIGVDLSWEYLHLSRERLGLVALDAWNGKPMPMPEMHCEDLPLFFNREAATP